MNQLNFKEALWKAADALRAQMDAAEYKHIVLGLIFLKYISDSFEEQKEKIKKIVSDKKSDLFISEDPEVYKKELEDRDYYTQDNVFWVPPKSRWEKLVSQGKQPNIGELIDKALLDIENENKSLRGLLDKRYGQSKLAEGTLGKIIDLISKIGFSEKQKKGDILGEVYEYFLGQFALAEGKKGGQFYTPRNVVQTLVEVLEPYKGRVYDPCCGSGGMFVMSEEFVVSHGGKKEDISIFGQESNPTTWRLAAMNLAIRKMSANLGAEPTDTFSKDQHPEKSFDYILMNPFFNDSDWGGEKHQDDKRWIYGTPPESNANYAWIQHVISKLSQKGKAGIVLSNSTMTAGKSEENIRKGIINADHIDAVVTLPKKLFLNFKGSVCLWFISKNKSKISPKIKNKILFIDARNIGSKVSRSLYELSSDDIKLISNTIKSWKNHENYKDKINFCRSVDLIEIKEKDYLLLPGIYVEYKQTEKKVNLNEEIKFFQNQNIEIEDKIEKNSKNIDELLKEIYK